MDSQMPVSPCKIPQNASQSAQIRNGRWLLLLNQHHVANIISRVLARKTYPTIYPIASDMELSRPSFMAEQRADASFVEKLKREIHLDLSEL